MTCLTSLGCLGDGPYIASGSHDCSIKVFDIAVGKAVNKMIMRAKSKCTGLAAVDGGSSLVSGHMDGSLRFGMVVMMNYFFNPVPSADATYFAHTVGSGIPALTAAYTVLLHFMLGIFLG